MAEEKTKTDNVVGKVEVPTTADVARSETMKVGNINITANVKTKTEKAYESSKAEATVADKKSQYSVEAIRSVNATDPTKTIVSDYVGEKTVSKKSNQSSSQNTIETFTDTYYSKSVSTYTSYQDKKNLRNSAETSGYTSSALGKAHGYEDSSFNNLDVETTTTDNQKRVRLSTSHSERTSNDFALRNDIKTIMKADGTVKQNMEVKARHGNGRLLPNGAEVYMADGNSSTFSADTYNNSTHYKIHNLKTGDETHLYDYDDGTVLGYQYNEKTDSYKELSDKETRREIKRNQERASKIIKNVTATKGINTLQDYYALLPNVGGSRTAMPAGEIFNSRYEQEAGYQQTKAAMTEQNRQEVANRKQITAEDIVAAKIKQHGNSGI